MVTIGRLVHSTGMEETAFIPSHANGMVALEAVKCCCLPGVEVPTARLLETNTTRSPVPRFRCEYKKGQSASRSIALRVVTFQMGVSANPGNMTFSIYHCIQAWRFCVFSKIEFLQYLYI